MKFWAYFAAKILASVALLYGAWRTLEFLLPKPEIFLYTHLPRFPNDLGWTTALLCLWLLAVALAYTIVWDQRRRCRTCLRRLRMPVEHGNWGEATLFAPPHTESICPYGHGTLHVPDVHLSASTPESWRAHQDIWAELEGFGPGRR